ncbi:peptidase domain-containing ABC transporter [Shewanella fidelis]|uniref:ATP-binding cassette domain-containing protein n=1 Tax=Shewanella fidelis TaxID=173509 RepID=A0AAW8NSS6_9GAMM|nr:ATP-binding cassette domain-containing protein [Shewanella fidelis]MDR8525251.1 ATP-binding cassette domain-containing protein [Shewanella fidelis]MDW4811322.1 ATP-binding cassette domain-containing protein [Shewanella fidelis]MDW4814899.1 ATP-binding cassette domain-containing protein [Shewanella fidelis]MDW4818989.1 ATP-binding cassette domain-containing protein [Shewanella fidelis]MDW4823334.1 ATP-binding cassette domain-containing protein [Shewanella fidelis]
MPNTTNIHTYPNSTAHTVQQGPADTELKQLLITLFQQLGLFAQATNLQTDTNTGDIDTCELAGLLSKHHIGFSVVKFHKQVISQSIHPFIVVPEDAAAFLVRRRNEALETFDKASEQWRAIKLEAIPSSSHLFVIESLPTSKQNIRGFSAHLAKRTKWYRPVFWLSLLSSVTGLAVPLFTMAVYDKVIGGQAPNVLPSIALGAALALAILIASRLTRANVLASTSNRFARDLSNLTFRRLLSMPLMVLSRVGLSNHIARMRNAEKVRTLVSGPGGAGLVDLPFTLIAFITIALLSGWLVIVPIVMLMLFYLVMKAVNKFAQSASPTISTDYQNSINELAKNLLQLKTSGETDGWNTKFARQCKENCRQNFLYAKRNGLNAAIAHAMSLLTALVTVFTGIFLVLNQSISPGALIACVMLIWRITGPAQLAFSSTQKITMMKSAVQQFDRFMQASTENNELRLDTPDTFNAPAINFQHVTLRYSADTEPALSGVSATIEPGENVAIIGPNACGKTSLLLAAMGVVEAQAGYVTVNNKNLKQYDPHAFRQWAAFCPAEPDLFPGSLAENLRIAKPDASDEDLIQALHSAGGASLFSALNNDLNIDLFNRGHTLLSAVEGSYISLARALLKQSSLVILDEPIANRNPAAKAALLNTFETLKGKATVLFTSHDQDLIQQADKVIILDKGAVVYAGPIPDQSQSTASIDSEENTPHG